MKRNRFYLYLILNIIVSAATTLIVLVVWDSARKAEIPVPPAALVQAGAPAASSPATATPEGQVPANTLPPPAATETLPPPGTPLIEIAGVVAVGDLDNEVVLLKRVGTGNLPMTGWKLAGQGGTTFTFSTSPELILYKDGAVQIFSKAGTDTVTDVYMNRDKPAWRGGELIKLLDPQGNERANYQIP
jgi:hypothetical protein